MNENTGLTARMHSLSVVSGVLWKLNCLTHTAAYNERIFRAVLSTIMLVSLSCLMLAYMWLSHSDFWHEKSAQRDANTARWMT